MDNSGNLIVENIFILGFHDRELREFLKGLNVPGLQVLNRTPREAVALTPPQMEGVRAIYRLDISLIEQAKIHGPLLNGSFSVRPMGTPNRAIERAFYGILRCPCVSRRGR
jgi:hypothetical protein